MNFGSNNVSVIDLASNTVTETVAVGTDPHGGVPVQFLLRRATEDVEIAGTAVPKDSIVLPIFASANRDERRFPDGERFDVTRNTQGHVAFGHGIHFCLGAPLARLEGAIALEAILSRLDNIEYTGGEIEIIDSPLLRGPKHLPLTFDSVAEAVKA